MLTLLVDWNSGRNQWRYLFCSIGYDWEYLVRHPFGWSFYFTFLFGSFRESNVTNKYGIDYGWLSDISLI